jgi:hypothetical protein
MFGCRSRALIKADPLSLGELATTCAIAEIVANDIPTTGHEFYRLGPDRTRSDGTEALRAEPVLRLGGGRAAPAGAWRGKPPPVTPNSVAPLPARQTRQRIMVATIRSN